MAKKFGARKCSKYKVVCISPSVNRTPAGLAIPPIPYPVHQDLSTSVDTATNVRFNAYIGATGR